MSDSTVMTEAQIKRTRNIYLYASAIALLVFGLIYAWSIFASPIAATYGWAKGQLQTTFNIAMVCFCLAGLCGAFVNKVLSTKATIILSGIMMMIGFIGTAIFAPRSLWGIYIFYGVFCGAGCGLGYIMILSVVNSWWSDKIGFASGIMMMGMGFGSLILGSAANSLINAIGVQAVFYVLAAVAFIVPLILAFLIKAAPSCVQEIIVPKGGETVDESSYENDNILKTPAFYVYLIWAFFIIATGLTLIGGSRQGAEIIGLAPSLAALIVGLVSTMNGLSRPLFGTMCDKLGIKVSMLFSASLCLVASILIVLSYAQNLGITFFIGALMMGLGYGAIPVVASAFARERFGAKNYTRNLGTINLSAAIGSFLSIGLIAIASPDGSSTNLQVWIVFAFAAAIAFIGGILFAIVYKKPGDANKDAKNAR